MTNQYIRARVVIQNKETKELWPMLEDFIVTDKITWKDIRQKLYSQYKDTEFEILKIEYKPIDEPKFIR